MLKPKILQRKDPEKAVQLVHQAATLIVDGNHRAALPLLDKALRLDQSNDTGWLLKGQCHIALGDLGAGETCMLMALRYNFHALPPYESLMHIYNMQGEHKKLQAICAHVLKLDPMHRYAHVMLEISRGDAGDLAGQQAIQQEFWARVPCAESYFLAHCQLPTILTSTADETAARQRVIQALTHVPTSVAPMDELPIIPMNPSFYCAYHQGNPKEIMQALATFCRTYFPKLLYTAPHVAAWQPRAPGTPIKVGFVSAHMDKPTHAVTMIYGDLIRALAKDPALDVHIVHVAPTQMAGAINATSDVATAQQIIAREAFDILIYTDIGMEPITYFLAHARLAPIQCVAEGHPITTGLPGIDYILGTDALMGPGAEDYYTEQLVRLPGVPAVYADLLEVAAQDWTQLGLPAEATIYMCAQTLFKVHPDMDQAFAGILAQDPRAHIVLFDYPQTQVPNIQARLGHLDRLHILPRQNFATYLGFLKGADVALDTFPFGGGNTSYHAFGLGVPVVTLPDPTTRGRAAHGFYQLMGVAGCSVATVQDYINVAVRLGTDKSWRAEISAQILQHRDKIFGNQDIVQGYANFIKSKGYSK